MNTIDYFKLQAKNLHKDFKTQKPCKTDDFLYEYTPKYFDIDGIVLDFNLDEDDFTLMKAQHVIAQLVGFKKWTDLLTATEDEMELAKLLFDNQHLVGIETWEDYVNQTEEMNQTEYDSESKLSILKIALERQVFDDSSRNYLLR